MLQVLQIECSMCYNSLEERERAWAFCGTASNSVWPENSTVSWWSLQEAQPRVCCLAFSPSD